MNVSFCCFVLVLVFLTETGAAPFQNATKYDLKIVGGEATDISLHPWHVAIEHLNDYFCGGFLVSSNRVVTAAHCLVKGYTTDLNIRAGTSIRNNGGQVVGVTSFTIHPYYNLVNEDNDIAILNLAEGVTIENARPATLPAQNDEVWDGYMLTVTGWGYTEAAQYSDQLLQVQVPTISTSQCGNIYANINLQISNNEFCAGYIAVGGKDACNGDSGSPAELFGQIVGIVSWGVSGSCGSPIYPGVYTKVSQYVDWLRQHM